MSDVADKTEEIQQKMPQAEHRVITKVDCQNTKKEVEAKTPSKSSIRQVIIKKNMSDDSNEETKSIKGIMKEKPKERTKAQSSDSKK